MARGETLEKVLADFRLEAGLSPSPALNVQDRERQVLYLQREQERLWAEYDWPHLRVERYVQLQPGQRFYDPLAATNEAGEAARAIPVDRISCLDVKREDVWTPLLHGIRAEDYAEYDSVLDERADPARRWRATEDDQIEIWPLPNEAPDERRNGWVRITGIRRLQPFVDARDRADLDDRLISLYAAAQYLAAKNSPEAQTKLQMAQQHLGKLRGNLTHATGFQLFGRRRPECRRPAEIPYPPRILE